MGHPIQRNDTPFELFPLFVADEDGAEVLACVVKGTYSIDASRERLVLAEPQVPVDPVGLRNGSEDDSSYRYEPETAFVKPATDVVLVGHAHASKPGELSLDVGIKVGPVQKIVRVFGDRWWVKQGGHVLATRPQPFERIPLIYERAFGGWDRSHEDESKWRFEPTNPVGRGFGDPLRFLDDGRLLMPNLEDPNRLMRHYGDTPTPAGFGFISPHWHPRARYAGTYDERWANERKPLLPQDFDRRFFNAAPPGLIAPGYLRGDEEVVVVNASPVPRLRFMLPGVPPPECRIGFRAGKTLALRTNLDTVIIDTDQNMVTLLWRTYARSPGGAHAVVALELDAGDAAPQHANVG